MATALNSVQLPIRAVRMALFPTMDTPEEVLEYAESQLPIMDKNTLVCVLMTYHNTLLKLQERR